MKKFWFLGGLLVAPFIVGWIANQVWLFPILLVSGFVYIFLFLCLTPSGDFLSASANYETKKINPNHSVETVSKRSMDRLEILRLILLFLLGAACFYYSFN